MPSSPITKRVFALLLTITLVGGSAAAAAADIMRHHMGQEGQATGRHVEEPGSCLDHSHRCDLGLLTAGPRLPGQTAPHPRAAYSVAEPPRSSSQLADDAPATPLPPSRAPPAPA